MHFSRWISFFANMFNVLMVTKLSDVFSGMYSIKTGVARQLGLNTRGF